jgi:radical SAM protein with 4Fe4S-binding SPASM domain
MYFRLNSECYFVRGKGLSAIYDLIDEKIYTLDPQETNILASCEENNSVSEDERILRELKALRLGNFYPNKIYVTKLRDRSFRESDVNPPELNRAFLELNNICKRDCWFCGYHGVKRSAGCIGCNKWKEKGENLTTKRWMEILDELSKLECQNIFLKGGDLTLSWDSTMDILDHASGMFSNIYITLHQQSISETIMDDLANKSKLIIQTENLKNTLSDDIIYLLTLKPEERIKLENDNVEFKNKIIDFVIDDAISLRKSKQMAFMTADISTFCHKMKYHPCLGCTIAISFDGRFMPCPMMRNRSFGNVRNKPLHTIFETKMNDLNKFWMLNLDNIDKCKDCEFRYACGDCRALEEKLTGKIDGKVTCSYDPLEGKWL